MSLILLEFILFSVDTGSTSVFRLIMSESVEISLSSVCEAKNSFSTSAFSCSSVTVLPFKESSVVRGGIVGPFFAVSVLTRAP